MAIANKCDICGRLYEFYETRVPKVGEVNSFRYMYTTPNREMIGREYIDCCPKCMKSIIEHIESLKKGEPR